MSQSGITVGPTRVSHWIRVLGAVLSKGVPPVSSCAVYISLYDCHTTFAGLELDRVG